MASALRVRVTWDGTVVENRLFTRRRRVQIGAGPRAKVAAPSGAGYATVRLRGHAVEIEIEPGAAEAIEFPGGERIDLIDAPRFRRRLEPPFGAAAISVGGALVEIERIALAAEAGDRAMWAWAAAALVIALIAGSSYKLVRLCGDGERAQWGTPPSLSSMDVTRVRVRVGPEGRGSSRPQAGAGLALHGRADAPIARTTPPHPVRHLHKKRLAARTPHHAQPAASVKGYAGPAPQMVQHDVVGAVQPTVGAEKPDGPAERAKVLEDAQSALLSADLRKAIDSFNRAAHDAPLDYDQLNWLGLAQYLSGEYDGAEKTWKEARDLDAGRADAINNLASVAKRRGDTASELAYLKQALVLDPGDCHASNSLALAEAKSGDRAAALTTLTKSDAACGGHYAYTEIQRAGILSLAGDRDGAFRALADGLARTDTLIPIKEFEVLDDLRLDPAFAGLRSDARFGQLIARYLPRASEWDRQGG